MVDVINYQVSSVGKVQRVLDFINNNTFFFALGKNTPWDKSWGDTITDNSPPYPGEDDTTIPDILVLKRADKVVPCVESACGELDFLSCGTVENKGKKLTLINLEKTDRRTLNILAPEKVYIGGTFLDTEIPSNFRTIGLFAGIEVDQSLATNFEILYSPEQIKDYGTMYWAAYSTPLIYTINREIKFELILTI